MRRITTLLAIATIAVFSIIATGCGSESGGGEGDEAQRYYSPSGHYSFVATNARYNNETDKWDINGSLLSIRFRDWPGNFSTPEEAAAPSGADQVVLPNRFVAIHVNGAAYGFGDCGDQYIEAVITGPMRAAEALEIIGTVATDCQ